MRAYSWTVVALALTLGGCRAKLGECNEPALRIVYTVEGNPMFAGQALTQRYCANGECHNSSVTGSGRRGAPFGFDMDTVHLDVAACTPGTLNTDACLLEQRRLAVATQVAFDFRDLSWNEIEQDRMPPVGARNLPDTDTSGLFFSLTDGGDPNTTDPVPSLREPEGRELIRNWLACGLPIVGVLEPTRDTASFEQACPESTIPDDSFFQCRFAPIPRMEIAPNFDDIFAFIEQQQCNTSACHGGTEAPNMTTRMEAFESLTTGTGPTPGNCLDLTAPYVNTESPEASLF
ncbi:MAG: hypothetical protein AAF645_16670, partial [Myxococcota bacterium]